jgi:hypothetical protein
LPNRALVRYFVTSRHFAFRQYPPISTMQPVYRAQSEQRP